MKNILNVFINLVVVFAFGIGYAPLAVLAQETGTVQPPPPSGSFMPPPPSSGSMTLPTGGSMPPPSPSNMLPPSPGGSVTLPTHENSFEPNRMPPPPEGNGQFMPPPQGFNQQNQQMQGFGGTQSSQKFEPKRMPPPPSGQNRMQQSDQMQGQGSDRMSPQGEENNRNPFRQETKGQKSNGQKFDNEQRNMEKGEKGDENGEFEHEEGDFEEPVDPKELKDALRQLKDLKKQIQRTLKQAQKSANFTSEKEELNSLLSEVSSFSQSLSDDSVGRDTLQEFYDAQIWDKFNAIRIKVEFPQEIKNIEKDLKRVEKLLATKNFSVERIDIGAIRAKVEEIKSAINQARESFNAGNFDDAQEALSIIHEGLHPGEVFGILNQLREIDKRLKSMKDEVKSTFQEALAPVYEAIAAGDFREANQMLNDVRNELFKLFGKVKSKSTNVSSDIRQKLRSLEGQLENKHQQLEKQNSSSQESQSLNYERYAPYKASVLETLTGWLNFSK